MDDGIYGVGHDIVIITWWSAPVAVLDGTPCIQMEVKRRQDAMACYSGGNNTDRVEWTYTVQDADLSRALPAASSTLLDYKNVEALRDHMNGARILRSATNPRLVADVGLPQEAKSRLGSGTVTSDGGRQIVLDPTAPYPCSVRGRTTPTAPSASARSSRSSYSLRRRSSCTTRQQSSSKRVPTTATAVVRRREQHRHARVRVHGERGRARRPARLRGYAYRAVQRTVAPPVHRADRVGLPPLPAVVATRAGQADWSRSSASRPIRLRTRSFTWQSRGARGPSRSATTRPPARTSRSTQRSPQSSTLRRRTLTGPTG